MRPFSLSGEDSSSSKRVGRKQSLLRDNNNRIEVPAGKALRVAGTRGVRVRGSTVSLQTILEGTSPAHSGDRSGICMFECEDWSREQPRRVVFLFAQAPRSARA